MKQITLILIAFHFSSLMTAQTTIQGNVTDEISALTWANIHIKNSTIGTTSDKKGNFTIEANKGDTLAISYTGYQTKEIVINNQKFIPVTLDNETLDEVVITKHYSRTKTMIICGKISVYTTQCKTQGIKIETLAEDIISEKIPPSLYPNPSSDGIFNLKMANSYKEVQVYVTNILGQQVQSRVYKNTRNLVSLDLSSLRTGIYLINSIADGKRLPTQKAIRR